MFQKGNKLGNRFSSTNQPISRGINGRKSNLLKKPKYQLSSDDCKTIMLSILSMTRKEAEELVKDADAPVLDAAIARAILKEGSRALMEVLKFNFGSKTEIEANINGQGLSHEEVAVLIKDMLKD